MLFQFYYLQNVLFYLLTFQTPIIQKIELKIIIIIIIIIKDNGTKVKKQIT